MNCGPHVLGRCIPHNLRLTGIRVDFDIDQMHGKRTARRVRIDAGCGCDPFSAFMQLGCQFFEGHQLAARAVDRTVLVPDLCGVDFPDQGRAIDEQVNHLQTRLVHSLPRGISHTASPGHVGVAHVVGIGNERHDILGRDPQRLRQLHRQSGPRSANVGRAFDESHLTVNIHRQVD